MTIDRLLISSRSRMNQFKLISELFLPHIMVEHPPFHGTVFQVKVWNAMKEIPRGRSEPILKLRFK
jgi:O6-methylguanine-DNA--protein-cysteine methyltransferase